MTEQTLPTPTFFLMKDLYTKGMDLVLDRAPRLAYSSLDIVEGYRIIDDGGFDKETGAPDYDRHVWYALGRLLVAAGAIEQVAIVVKATPSTDGSHDWAFFYDLPEAGEDFLTLRFTDDEDIATLVPQGFPTRALGDIVDVDSYVPRIGAYALSVHPRLAERSPSSIAILLAMQLRDTGLLVKQIYHPMDTAKHYARYVLSDGLQHAVIDFHGPRLVQALSVIDAFVGRTAEEGGLINDLEPQTDTTIHADLAADNDGLPS